MRNARIFIVLIILLGLILLFPISLSAANGKISGKVLDKKMKEPIVRTVATLVKNSEKTAQTAITDKSGYFRILKVPPGIYDIEVTATGHNKLIIKRIKVQTDMTIDVGQIWLTNQSNQVDTLIFSPRKRPPCF